MIADEVDGPSADEHERSDHRDDGGADHDVAIACAKLADNGTAAVGEHHRAASLDNGRGLLGHDISAEIEFARRDPDQSDHERGSETDHHNLEVGGAVCGVHRPVHIINQITLNSTGTLYFRTMHPIPKYRAPASIWLISIGRFRDRLDGFYPMSPPENSAAKALAVGEDTSVNSRVRRRACAVPGEPEYWNVRYWHLADIPGPNHKCVQCEMSAYEP